MSLKSVAVMVLFLSSSLAACTGRSGKSIEVGTPRKPQPAETNKQGETPVLPDEQQQGAVVSGDGSEMNVRLSEAELKQYDIDTANLDYAFTYKAYSNSGTLSFVGGSALIKLTGLPVDQTGDMVLELKEKGVVRARGVASAVTLKKGFNAPVQLKVAAISAGGTPGQPGQETTNVDINVTLEGPGGAVPITPATPATPPATTPTTPTTPVTPTTPSDSDLLATWNGLSFVGNSKWTIRPVD